MGLAVPTAPQLFLRPVGAEPGVEAQGTGWGVCGAAGHEGCFCPRHSQPPAPSLQTRLWRAGGHILPVPQPSPELKALL